jgi:effector-binding domain-containing protein
MFEVLTRETEDQQVLTEIYYGTTDGLTDWLDSAIGRLWERAGKYGGVTGAVFVAYHGEITPESHGTIEACIPIAIDQQVPLAEPHRFAPAHREAYTRLKKNQVVFPEILDAYKAVEKWVKEKNETMVAAPREVYFTDFMNAGDEDDVTDVAFPIAFLST